MDNYVIQYKRKRCNGKSSSNGRYEPIQFDYIPQKELLFCFHYRLFIYYPLGLHLIKLTRGRPEEVKIVLQQYNTSARNHASKQTPKQKSKIRKQTQTILLQPFTSFHFLLLPCIPEDLLHFHS